MTTKSSESIHKKKVQNQEIVKAIQDNAKEHFLDNVQNKVKEVSTYLEEQLRDTRGLTATQVFNVIASRSVSDIATISNKTFTPQEMSVALTLYIQMMAEINKYTAMPPSKASFCMLVGMSLQCYNNYLQDPEMSEVMNLIETYITGTKLTSAQLGELKEISTIFDLKSQHGFVEAQAPTTIIHEKKIDVDDIRSQLMELKRGKAIEIDYEEKN